MNSDRPVTGNGEAKLEEKAWNPKEGTCKPRGGVSFSSKACG